MDSFDDRYLGTKSSDPTLDNDGNALVSGALYFSTTQNVMKVYDGASWITATSAGATSLIRFRYVATSGQTTFSGADSASATLTYTVNNIVVMRNGVTLDTSEYTASNGTSIVLGVAAGTGDIVDIVAFKSFTVADALSAVSGGTVNGAVTVTGALAASTLKATTTIGVGAATPSTSGAGITFPVAQSASTNANTLDDYEEGTWTPVDGSGASLSFTVTEARYTKIGRMVQCFAQIAYPSTANTNQAKISGLPFTMETTVGGAYGAFTVYTTEPVASTWLNLSNTATSVAYSLGGGNATNATFSTDNFRLVWIYESA